MMEGIAEVVDIISDLGTLQPDWGLRSLGL